MFTADAQRLFCEMMKIEMLFHAKAIETLSQGFTAVHSINEADDLSEFRRAFKLVTFLPSSVDAAASDASLMQASLSSLSLSRFSQSDSSVGKGESNESNTTEESREDESSDSGDDLTSSLKAKHARTTPRT